CSSRSVPNGTHICSGITSARLFVYGEENLGMLRTAILGGWTVSIDSDGGDFNNVLFNDHASFFFPPSFHHCPQTNEFCPSPFPPSPIHRRATARRERRT